MYEEGCASVLPSAWREPTGTSVRTSRLNPEIESRIIANTHDDRGIRLPGVEPALIMSPASYIRWTEQLLEIKFL